MENTEQAREPTQFYSDFALKRKNEIAIEKALVRKLSLARLFVFFIMSIFVFLCFEADPFNWAWLVGALPFLLIFGFLVRIHERHQDALENRQLALASSEEAMASLKLEWAKLPPPLDLNLEGQDAVVARDLSLTGDRSLFHRMARMGWEMGTRVLKDWAFTPLVQKEQELRKSKIEEWANHPDSLLEWQAHARRKPTIDDDSDLSMLEWCESKVYTTTRSPAIILLLVNLAVWTLVIRSGNSAPLLPLLFVNWASCRFLSRKFDPRILLFESRINSLLDSGKYLEKTPLFDEKNDNSSTQLEDTQRLEKLAKLISMAMVFRSEMMHQILQVFLFWDAWLLPMIEDWKKKEGKKLRTSLQRRFKEEALATLALWRYEHPHFQWPCYTGQGTALSAESMGHPLLGDDVAVTNDVTLDPSRPLLVLGGSNMSGKSTLLRALGLNLILARMGAVTFCQKLEIPPLELRTSFRIDDSLSQGLSFFMSELQQLKEVNVTLKTLPEGKKLLFLFDEILLGTNLQERREAIGRVLQHLLEKNCMGALATHDLDSLDRPGLKEKTAMYHMGEGVFDDGDKALPHFDYRLKEGICHEGNALRLLESSGALD